MKKFLIIFVFVLLSIKFPIDIFETSRYKTENFQVHEQQDLSKLKYGFGRQLFFYYQHPHFGNAKLHMIRFLASFPFIVITLQFPKMKFIINLLLLGLCLILIRKLNKRYATLWWYLIPLGMFFISFRSFLPGILLALFISEPCFLFAFLALIYSCFSSAMVALYSFLVFVIFLRKRMFLLLFLSLIPLYSLFIQKGFHFGQISNQQNRYSPKGIFNSLKISLQNNSFIWFYQFSFHRDNVATSRDFNRYYNIFTFIKLLVLFLCCCTHLVLCIVLYKNKLRFASMVYASALLFAFLEGYGYSSFFICLFIGFVALIKNRIEIIDIR